MSDFLPPALQAVEAAGHTAFIEGLYNLNIIGVRHPNPRAGVFDVGAVTVSWIYRLGAEPVLAATWYSLNR